MTFTIRRATEDDWAAVRDLRLEMLADTPMGYAETLATAQALDDAAWRQRAARGALVAITDTGRWVGTMNGYVDAGRPMLVGVYVTPDFRGSTGVGDALLAEVEHWAREHGDELVLHVHADNARARRYYEKRGFVATGVTVPYILNAAETELEMAKAL